MKQKLYKIQLYTIMGLNYLLVAIDFILDLMTTANVTKFKDGLEKAMKKIEDIKAFIEKMDLKPEETEIEEG